jgi:hypothetical protein
VKSAATRIGCPRGLCLVITDQRPNGIQNYTGIRDTPLALGAVLALLAVGTLVHVLLTGVRRRRRDLALLKTLGLLRSQLLRVVSWQPIALAAAALLAGLPLGLLAGRRGAAHRSGVEADQHRGWPAAGGRGGQPALGDRVDLRAVAPPGAEGLAVGGDEQAVRVGAERREVIDARAAMVGRVAGRGVDREDGVLAGGVGGLAHGQEQVRAGGRAGALVELDLGGDDEPAPHPLVELAGGVEDDRGIGWPCRMPKNSPRPATGICRLPLVLYTVKAVFTASMTWPLPTHSA